MLFEEKKDYYLINRLQQRMSELGIISFNEYYKTLIFEDRSKELQSFIESITINETYFFRDFPQLQGFAEKVLPAYLEQKRKKFNSVLKVWSAACSTGEEAYTLSIILQEMIEDYAHWSVSVEATDIDRNVIGHAEKGIYSERSMKDTPEAYRKKYFVPMGEEWQVSKLKKHPIDFKTLNFTDKEAMKKMRNFDVIFCRNVLIYFDDQSRKSVVNLLYDSLIPGGHLFLGHSENIGRITAAFELQTLGGFICYRRPL
ncbi:MAG: protein-glutamate O-methyltransferase CheR [Oligoflexia bacterium]|nr:protein-glutamate O-methyltransferase CheR [Oligoflexia bacterium]MBF0366968.1 protein-glutamate O-methyltransferase CheR [Oligoflexia bacterium]